MKKTPTRIDKTKHPAVAQPPAKPTAVAPPPVAGASSPERIAANGQNAQHSTGPRTQEGRAIASQNATRHGLFSAKALIPGESPEEFEAFRQHQLSHLQLRGGIENLIAEQFVITSWRLQRLERIEAEAFARYSLSSKGEVMGAGFAMIASIQGDNFLSTLGRYEAGLRRQYFRCLDTMHGLRKSGQFPYLPAPLLEVETVPPGPPAGPAPGQGRPQPVADSPGRALDLPAPAPSAGDPAPSEDPAP